MAGSKTRTTSQAQTEHRPSVTPPAQRHMAAPEHGPGQAAPGSAPAPALLRQSIPALQRSIGNRAVQRMLASQQPRTNAPPIVQRTYMVYLDPYSEPIDLDAMSRDEIRELMSKDDVGFAYSAIEKYYNRRFIKFNGEIYDLKDSSKHDLDFLLSAVSDPAEKDAIAQELEQRSNAQESPEESSRIRHSSQFNPLHPMQSASHLVKKGARNIKQEAQLHSAFDHQQLEEEDKQKGPSTWSKFKSKVSKGKYGTLKAVDKLKAKVGHKLVEPVTPETGAHFIGGEGTESLLETDEQLTKQMGSRDRERTVGGIGGTGAVTGGKALLEEVGSEVPVLGAIPSGMKALSNYAQSIFAKLDQKRFKNLPADITRAIELVAQIKAKIASMNTLAAVGSGFGIPGSGLGATAIEKGIDKGAGIEDMAQEAAQILHGYLMRRDSATSKEDLEAARAAKSIIKWVCNFTTSQIEHLAQDGGGWKLIKEAMLKP